jgi:hypothetical protein
MLLYIAAGLILIDAIGHSVTGETGLLMPLLREDQAGRTLSDPGKQRLLHVAWHQASLAWVVMAVHIASMADAPDPVALSLYAAVFALNLGSNTWATRRSHPSMLLLAGAALILIGVAVTSG